MTRLLVSVQGPDEALLAVECGAQLIDVKDPRHGSLGATSPAVWQAVMAAVGEYMPVSAALGELLDREVLGRAQATAGLTFAKVGLAGCGALNDWQARWYAWQQSLATGVQAVAVIYADWNSCGAPAPDEVLDLAAQADIAAVLIDTFDKTRGSVLQLRSTAELAALASEVQQAQLMLVVAGSLQLGDVSALLPLRPAYLAVRGAVCDGPRSGQLSAAKIRQWSRALSTPQDHCQALR
ncbi:hypothetical protein ETAA8_51150 [Anatilimnocola aggregata]|uniref:(5-formylfuran-3-yl)methyl phosphate synthase n=1 Tax=Anatilimnocola aggregata TaxID=2528021 RepID=A0A517YID6_9BACT|nr:(5-formylfuran-3-yl)methyl phosphate synthase [Anatilimnocola aggregata]QDU29997.1 hypothetical protein ETAA8_51150 [Anatilimnocola aggregata]